MTDWIHTIDVPAVLTALGIQWEDTGREALARCPNFHAHERGDERPSWRIVIEPEDPAYAAHHCHPCGFSGGILLLVSHLRGISWGEAAEWLGAPAPSGAPSDPLVEGAEWIDWSGDGSGAGRGIRETSLAAPELVPPDGCQLIRCADDWPEWARVYWRIKVGTPPADAIRWGCLWGAGGRLTDRIVFPASTGGRLLSYSARLVDFRGPIRSRWRRMDWPGDDAPAADWIDALDRVPADRMSRAAITWFSRGIPAGIRYLTPRERDHPKKSWLRAEPGAATRRALFGWDGIWPGGAGSAVTLVEGAIKAARLAAAGWPNPVAMFGVGLTHERAALLRTVSTVYYPGDPDDAGRLLLTGRPEDPSWKGLSLMEAVNSRLTRVVPIGLPRGRPVDSISVTELDRIRSRHGIPSAIPDGSRG